MSEKAEPRTLKQKIAVPLKKSELTLIIDSPHNRSSRVKGNISSLLSNHNNRNNNSYNHLKEGNDYHYYSDKKSKINL